MWSLTRGNWYFTTTTNQSGEAREKAEGEEKKIEGRCMESSEASRIM